MTDRTAGPYRLLAELGSGGMGTVWRAEGPGGVAAVKVVHDHVAATPGFLERFEREGRIGRLVAHANVVATLDSGDGPGRPWIALEYVEGRTLRALLDEMGTVPERLCRHVGREVARGLAALHAAGLVHRDVKPENVLVTRDDVVKVMDLGIARSADDALRLTSTGTFVGSVQYAAPEQFSGGGRGLDARADLHALGAVLYELATGVQPFHADDVSTALRRVLHETPRRAGELNPQLSPFLEEVLRTLLEKDRERRFPSADAVAEVLERGETSPWWDERARALRAATRRPLRRMRIPRETALHGRGAEIARLRAAFEAARSGEGRVVLVEGEAGIGKSRLVDELVGTLAAGGEDFEFLSGSYPPGGAATASGAFVVAFREHVGTDEDQARAALPDTPLLAPAFAALLRGDVAPPGAEPLSRDVLKTLFVRATQRAAADRPAIVLIDDLHFAPDEGRALFAALAHGIRSHRVLLVGTARPGLPETWTAQVVRLDHAERMAVPRLGPRDLVAVLVECLGSEHLAEELAAEIAVKSDGNPFFVFEILRGLREGRFLSRRPDGTWATTRRIQEIDVPPSIADVVRARVADLSDDERNLLDVAASIGFEFDPVLAGAVLGLGAIPALQRFASIEKRHRLVRSAGRSLVFDHHQVQEALYAGMLEPLREGYHAAIAEAIEARTAAAARDPADLDGRLAVDLATHFLAGAQGPRALRYLDAASESLVRASRNDAALRLLRSALAVPGLLDGRDRLLVVLRTIARLDTLGRPQEERAAVDEAIRLAEASGDPLLRLRALRARAWLLSRIHEGDEAEAAFRRAAELSRGLGDVAGEEAAERGMAGVAYDRGRFDEAEAHYARAVELARTCGSTTGLARATAGLGNVAFVRGRREEARRLWEDWRAAAVRGGDRRNVAHADVHLGQLHLELGEPDAARARLETALDAFRSAGDRRGEADTAGHLGAAAEDVGLLAQSLAHHDRSLQLGRETGDRATEAYAHLNLAGVRRQLGQRTAAAAHLDGALAVARSSSIARAEVAVLRQRGILAADAGDLAAAGRELEAAIAAARTRADDGDVATSLVELAAVRAAEGRGGDAARALEESVALGRDAAPPVAAYTALRLALVRGGDVAFARAAWLAAEPRCPWARRMAARLALWEAAGLADDLAEAARLLGHLVANAPPDRRDAMVAEVPLHRRIAAAATQR